MQGFFIGIQDKKQRSENRYTRYNSPKCIKEKILNVSNFVYRSAVIFYDSIIFCEVLSKALWQIFAVIIIANAGLFGVS